MKAEGPGALSVELKAEARARGFALVGIASPEASNHLAHLRDWLGEGRHGEMAYLARPDAVERRADLASTLESVRSVLVVADEYYQQDVSGVPTDPSLGVIARYARGRDYHKVVEGKLRDLLRWLETRVGGGVAARAYVDTGPLLERDLARRAGLGWFGRNTMLLNARRGSYFFLGVLLLDVELEADRPFEGDHCGSCNACVDACPTGALLGYDEQGAPVMDARLCISYLTIELRGPIPLELRPAIGNRVYGCDICQEVCPFNVRFAREATEPGYAARGPGELPTGVEPVPGVEAPAGEGVSGEPRGRHDAPVGRPHHPGREDDRGPWAEPRHPGTEAPPLVELMRMTRQDWDAFSRGSAIRRAGYAGFKRNVAVALGNWLGSVDEPPREAVAVLRAALESEGGLVREHAAWALEAGGPAAGLSRSE